MTLDEKAALCRADRKRREEKAREQQKKEDNRFKDEAADQKIKEINRAALSREEELEELKEANLICKLCEVNPARIDNKLKIQLCQSCIDRGSYLRKYKITASKYQEILKDQNGKCGICDCPMDHPCVDHCHTHNHVRGLLCRNCNLGLGFFKDNTNSLFMGLLYVLRNKKKRKWFAQKSTFFKPKT